MTGSLVDFLFEERSLKVVLYRYIDNCNDDDMVVNTNDVADGGSVRQ